MKPDKVENVLLSFNMVNKSFKNLFQACDQIDPL